MQKTHNKGQNTQPDKRPGYKLSSLSETVAINKCIKVKLAIAARINLLYRRIHAMTVTSTIVNVAILEVY